MIKTMLNCVQIVSIHYISSSSSKKECSHVAIVHEIIRVVCEHIEGSVKEVRV